MPCHDPRDSPSYKEAQIEQLRELCKKHQERADTVTQALCMMCSEIEVLIPNFIAERPPLNEWWENHKAWDARIKDIVDRAQNGGIITPEEKQILESLI